MAVDQSSGGAGPGGAAGRALVAGVGPVQAVDTGDTVYCAGQIGLDPATAKLVSGGTAAELLRVIQNLTAVLAGAGLGLGDVVRTTVYLVDMADGPLLNEVYGRLFTAPYPARATVQVAARLRRLSRP